MMILCFVVGFLATNCYIIACETNSEAIIVDAGLEQSDINPILREISKRELKVKYIVNTHGHSDHISGNSLLKKVTGAEILIHQYDIPMLADPEENLSHILGFDVISPPADRILHDGDRIKIGRLEFQVIHTPGHTNGSISLYSKNEQALFTGDTLFAGSIGRTDLPNSSFEDIIMSLRDKLMKLPDETIVYPGHGKQTTIGKEKQENPFL